MFNSIKLCTIASGSSGNSIYCESPSGALLVDAGISCKKVRDALWQRQLEAGKIKGIIITHSHSDHVRGAGAISRNLQAGKIPLFVTSGTRQELAGSLGKVQFEIFAEGDSFSLAGFKIEAIPTPHDVQGSVALVLSSCGVRLGIFTDLGHCFTELEQQLPTLDAVVMESNYDPRMLSKSSYPSYLKKRIRSSKGHLSNQEAAGLIQKYGTDRLRTVILGHLSENNNCPSLALACHRHFAKDFLAQNEVCLELAPRHQPSEIFRLRKYASGGEENRIALASVSAVIS